MKAEQKTVSRLLAEYTAGLTYEDLPANIVETAKWAVYDQLGCMLLGSTLPWTSVAYRFVKDMGGRPESTIVNFGTKTLAHDAGYVNGSFGQGAELDDYFGSGGGHGGAICVPAALALGEKLKIDGKQFITAVVIGYQVVWCVGRLMMPDLIKRGFHPQSILGVFAATAIGGKMLKLNEDQLVHAFGIAGSHASGTMEYDQTGGEVKRLHTGIAIRNGIESAMLAGYGLTGPTTIFEGKRGISTLFAGKSNTEGFEERLKKQWGILDRAVKTYACVGTQHSTIDVLAKIANENKVDPANVEKIDAWVAEFVLDHGAGIVEPKDVIGAQFSLAYSLAIRLLKGSNDLPLYLDPELWRDPKVLDLAHKVTVHGDPEFGEKRRRASRVTVKLKDGRTLTGSTELPRGIPGNPITKAEQVDKFERLAKTALPEAQVKQIIPKVEKLEEVKDISTVMPLLVKS